MTTKPSSRRIRLLQLATLAFGAGVWFSPVPEGLDSRTWHLFAIFIATIFSVIVGALPILVASVVALALSILTGSLDPERAYAGFSRDFILLIVVAFLVARAVVKSGLGARIAFHLIRRLGSTTLGLGYCVMILDSLIAPVFPSNTARSGVLFPIAYSLAVGNQSRSDDGTRHRVGAYLMLVGIASLTISSGLWMTAMAANPIGAQMAIDAGVPITFASWLLAACVPSLAAIIVLPWLLLRIRPPQVRHTPDAPQLARDELKRLGPPSRQEWLTGITFLAMVSGWALGGVLGIDRTALGFAGLAALMIGGVYTLTDLKGEGDALGTFIWFAILYALSTALNEMGFMSFVGAKIAHGLEGAAWPIAYVSLVTLYVLIHYLFVSQTAHLLALYGVFLAVAIESGVPASLAAYMLLFATNFFAAITPQASSANVVFAGSGYLRTQEIYRGGAVITLVNLLIFLGLGTPWILLLAL